MFGKIFEAVVTVIAVKVAADVVMGKPVCVKAFGFEVFSIKGNEKEEL